MLRLGRNFGSVATRTSLVSTDAIKASGTVYGGIHTITLIPGDGIGLEVSKSVKEIFKHAQVPIEWEQFDLTGYTEGDDTLLKQALSSIRKNKVALKGLLYTPTNRLGHVSWNGLVRKELDVYASTSIIQTMPNKSWPTKHENVDLAIIRENTEGEYSGLEHSPVQGVVESLKLQTVEKTKRVAKYAFDFALKNKRSKVTIVHKANIMKLGDGLFLKTCREVGKLYEPYGIKTEDMIVDNASMQLVSKPQQFDVIVCGNLYGNILSNIGSALVGGPGLIPGSNIGRDFAVFEPGCRHVGLGIMGRNSANPIGMILSGVFLLRHIGLNEHANVISKAIEAVVKEGKVKTPDLVRASKFVSRKSWIVTGSDDLQVKVFNYNTHEKVTGFEAHVDYIRCIAVHPTQPFLLTCSDDMKIKLWDWDRNWKNIMTFEGHAHFVMHVAFNPKDGNTFASASMDRTIKVWNVTSPVANFTLEGHSKGVNCVEYYESGDKPYLISGADDKLIKVWDYQQKTCVQTLEGHTNNVVRVGYHPTLPIIVSGSEDGTIRIWHSNTYRLENTLNYGMERVWCLAFLKGSNDMAFGYDEGTISIKIGKEEPTVSMDQTGKIVWAKQNEIQQVDLRQDAGAYQDGERIVLPVKDLGNCEVYPQMLKHSPNGRFAVVCGDGEYIIYTALSWRNKSFGQGLEFVWSADSNEYAIRESTSKIKLFRAFKEKTNVFIRPSFAAEGIFGGPLLAIKSSSFIMFYDWETGVVVRRVDVNCTNVFWSENDVVTIATPDSFYVLKYHRAVFQNHFENGVDGGDEGYEDAFEFVCEVPEVVMTGVWVGECFVYTNAVNRLNFLVGDQTSTISHFDMPMYVLGFIGRDNRVYICDKHLNFMSFGLPLSLIDYQNAVIKGDLKLAQELLPTIPADQRNKAAKFLDAKGHKQQALEITNDSEHRFELALQLDQLETAYQVAVKLDHAEKWKQLGDTSFHHYNFDLAMECWKRAEDLQSLLLMYQTGGDAEGLKHLSQLAMEKGEANIAFVCLYLIGDVVGCVDFLIEIQKIPEAAFFARTYCPSQIPRVVDLWRETLRKAGKPQLAAMIADPINHPELFPEYEASLYLEQSVRQLGLLPGHAYPKLRQVNILKDGGDIQGILNELVGAYHSRPVSPENQSSRSKSPQSRSISPARPESPVVRSESPKYSPAREMAKSRPSSPEHNDEFKTTPTTRPLSPQFDQMADNISHMSLEVNTTGTGSIRGTIDESLDFSDTKDLSQTDMIDDAELDELLG